MGFIFYEKSKRNAVDLLDEKLLNSFPESTKKVGVFVNAREEFIDKQHAKYNFQCLQLHGNESPEFCESFPDLKIIKAFGLDENFDFKVLEAYQEVVDYFLFDTKTPLHGGSGQTFNWNKLKEYNQSKPFFLSGGLSAENIKEVLQYQEMNIHAVDVNSKFELKPALKDIELLKNSVFKELR
jgi:phosphoribosylanthranilate isomerase